MTIEWLRDLAICILGFGVTLVALSLGVLAFMLYRKVRSILDSVKATARVVEDIASTVEEEVKGPLAQGAAFVQGISQAISLFRGFGKRKERGR